MLGWLKKREAYLPLEWFVVQRQAGRMPYGRPGRDSRAIVRGLTPLAQRFAGFKRLTLPDFEKIN